MFRKFFQLKCPSYLAKDVGALPLAVDRRGLDDELDLGQAGLPVHAAAVRVLLLLAGSSKDAHPVREGGNFERVLRTLSHTRCCCTGDDCDSDYDGGVGLQKSQQRRRRGGRTCAR